MRGLSAGLSPQKLSAAAQAGRLQIHGHTNSMTSNMHRTAFSSPEVILREPLEQDFVMNRRLANQINARDKEEAARDNREKLRTDKIKKFETEAKKKVEEAKTRDKVTRGCVVDDKITKEEYFKMRDEKTENALLKVAQ
jgi:hypothetical protein